MQQQLLYFNLFSCRMTSHPKSGKSLASTLIIQFLSLKLTGIRGVRDHIKHMMDISAQLKSLEVSMFESLFVRYILCTLPPQYSPFKISYNTHKDKWSINELLTMCVQEEEHSWNKGRRFFSLFLVIKGRISLRTR